MLEFFLCFISSFNILEDFIAFFLAIEIRFFMEFEITFWFSIRVKKVVVKNVVKNVIKNIVRVVVYFYGRNTQ